MKRREIISLLGGAAAWPIAARAQQPAMPVVGFLQSGSRGGSAHMVAAFQTGLREVGYIENQNVRIIFRYADGQYAKRIGLLHQLVPKVDAVGVLFNPTYTVAGAQLKEMEAAAASLNLRLIIANASADRDFEPAFELLTQQGAAALLVAPDPFFNSRRDRIVALAARHASRRSMNGESTP